ncbi:hypothetical protein KY321_01430, partial [Candidatus Woesearchaeota archaeon]|nr:hypothetical protein [Candidatus Woesearchaeota archaeon]
MKPKLNKTRKAQTEMVGLVIVVILLVFGLLVFLTLNQPKADTEVQDYYVNELSTKVLQVILHTTSDCSLMTGRQLIADVASNSVKVSSDEECTILHNSLITCNARDTYEVLFEDNFLEDMLSNSLGIEEFDYELIISNVY